MTAILYMAWRYLLYHKGKTLILWFSITLILFLPIGLHTLVKQSSEALTARADATPLIVGAKGSELELVLNSLYFRSEVPAEITYGQVTRARDYGMGDVIPLHVRFQVGKQPIVGTSVDYFSFRNLRFVAGRYMTVLGECVVGADAARQLGVSVGEYVISSPQGAFDVTGTYPLKMQVVGVLERSGMPDDEAVFVDVKTTWVIAGLAHGHEDISRSEAAAKVLRREGNLVIGNASLLEYNQITSDNMDSFHFHGNPAGFPVTAAIVVPDDRKSAAMLRGKYLGAEDSVQMIAPRKVIDELLETIFTVQRYVVLAVAVVGGATVVTMVLVFLLSLRLRRREIETMRKIGSSRRRVVGVLTAEIVLIVLLAVASAGSLTVLTAWLGPGLVSSMISG